MGTPRCDQTVTRWQHHAVRQSFANEIALELHNLEANCVLDVIVVSREGNEEKEDEQQNAEVPLPTLVLSDVQGIVDRALISSDSMRTADRNSFDLPGDGRSSEFWALGSLRS